MANKPEVMVKKVRIAKDVGFPPIDGTLEYAGGVWQREVDCELFHVAHNRGWFHKRWAVYKFAGADCAAIGGGAVWHDCVSDLFLTEYEAIQFLARLK